jgi:integrase
VALRAQVDGFAQIGGCGIREPATMMRTERLWRRDRTSARRREAKSGARFQVRYRLGERGYPVVHGGSFPTLREARLRRDLVAGELAAGRNSAEILRALVETPQRRTFAQVAADYRASRVDASEGTLRNLDVHSKLLGETFGAADPNAITAADVTTWIAAAPLKPSSLRIYFTTLRAILDFAGVEENPCRDQRVRLPRQERGEVNPPSAAEVEAIIEHVPSRWRLPLRVLEQTGMRVGELACLAWADVDVAGSRFRISQGKTPSARRWVAVPAWLMVKVAGVLPARRPHRRAACLSRLYPERRRERHAPRLHSGWTGALPPARSETPLRQCEDRGGRACHGSGSAARALEEEHDARHLLTRAGRLDIPQ